MKHLFVTAKKLSLIAIASSMIMAANAAPPTTKGIPYYPHQRTRATKKFDAGAVVVNAASYLSGISPGGLVTIFGNDLTSVTGIVYAGTDPLPTELEDVQVYINGLPAPIYGIAYANSQDQISVQVPYDTVTGPGAAEIQVYNSGVQTADITADSYTEDPGIFTYDSGDITGIAIAQDSNYNLIGPDNPAVPGDVIVLYTTGLGPLTVDLQDGYGAPSDPLAYTQDPFQVFVNNEQCKVIFSGLGPGFVGLYQVNLVLPDDLPSGYLNIQLFSTYANSGVAVLPVQ